MLVPTCVHTGLPWAVSLQCSLTMLEHVSLTPPAHPYAARPMQVVMLTPVTDSQEIGMRAARRLPSRAAVRVLNNSFGVRSGARDSIATATGTPHATARSFFWTVGAARVVVCSA